MKIVIFYSMLFFWNGQFGFSQTENFQLLEESEIIHIQCSYVAGSVLVRVKYLPENMHYSTLQISNLTKGGSAAIQLNQNLDLKFGVSLSFSDYVGSGDTLSLCIYRGFVSSNLNYPCASFVISEYQASEIKLGENCYKLSCIPDNDPWMPHAEQLFLFHKYEFYLNPKNGRIMKGKTAINSGYHTSCDLENWHLISPNQTYLDKNGQAHQGSDLISRRKIKLKEWDLSTFE